MGMEYTCTGTSPRAFPGYPNIRQSQFKYSTLLENVSIFLQISVKNSLSNQIANSKERCTFTGCDAVDLVFSYLKDFRDVETRFAPPLKEVTRTAALKFCQHFLEKRILEPVGYGKRSLGSGVSSFQDNNKQLYCFPLTEAVSSDISDLMIKCSLSDNKRQSTVSELSNGSSQGSIRDIRSDTFIELFGTYPLDFGDDMSICSSDSSSTSSESCAEMDLFTYWDANFQDGMDLWREEALQRLLRMTNIEMLEQILKPPKETEFDVFEACINIPFVQDLYRYSSLPPLVQEASALLGYQPQFSAALSRINISIEDIHPLTFVTAVHSHSKTLLVQLAEQMSFVGTLIQQVRGGNGPMTDGLFPVKHVELHMALRRILLTQKSSKAKIEAFQLYNLFIPWHRRDYLKRLLKFLATACGPDVPRLSRHVTNKDFLEAKFENIVFSPSTDQQGVANQQILGFMIQNSNKVFGIPNSVRLVVEDRINKLANFVDSNPSLADKYKQLSITEQSLVNFLEFLHKSDTLSSRKVKKYLERFRETYPEIWANFAKFQY